MHSSSPVVRGLAPGCTITVSPSRLLTVVPGAILLSPGFACCVCASAAALVLPLGAELSAPSGTPCLLGLSDLNRQASLLHKGK